MILHISTYAEKATTQRLPEANKPAGEPQRRALPYGSLVPLAEKILAGRGRRLCSHPASPWLWACCTTMQPSD